MHVVFAQYDDQFPIDLSIMENWARSAVRAHFLLWGVGALSGGPHTFFVGLSLDRDHLKGRPGIAVAVVIRRKHTRRFELINDRRDGRHDLNFGIFGIWPKVHCDHARRDYFETFRYFVHFPYLSEC